MMLAFLMAAHEERDDHKVVKAWVKQVRSVAYDVEDCLQDQAVRLGKPSRWCFLRTLVDRHRVATRMKELRAKVEDVSQRNVRYRLIKDNTGPKSDTGAGSSSIPCATMFGIEETRRQKDKAKVDLCQLINEGNEELRVIAVWGTSGVLGQSVLVNGAYDDLKRSNKFELYAWIRIVHPFNPLEFLHCVMRQFYSTSFQQAKTKEKANDIVSQVLKKMSLMEQDDLVDAFFEYVSEKSYMIVLNDMSIIEEWHAIMEYFPDNNKGSRIIVSTEHAEVASLCTGQESVVSELNQPSVGQSIFASHTKVFKEAINLDQYPALIEEAKMIMKKCNGLPLAIVTIGGFLAKQPKTPNMWRKLNEHISAELETNPELEIIRTILMKGYDGLPYHLKSCFFYMSIFPEDYNMSRRCLVRRWNAEGYSSEVRGKSMGDIADGYFMELIERSMVLPSNNELVGSRKGISSCKLHDLMREISISKAIDENLVFRMEEGCSLNNQGTIRHLAIRSNWEGYQNEFECTVDLSRIRSLTVFGRWKPFYISNKMKLLRVLDLESTSGLVDHRLAPIGKLLHLKYLSLRDCDSIFHLPESFGNLKQLETLDVTNTRIIKLQQVITKLRKLQYICAGKMDNNIFGVFSYEQIRNKLCAWTISFIFFCLSCCSLKFGKKCILEIKDEDPINRRDVCKFFCGAVFPFVARLVDPIGVVMPRVLSKLKGLHTLGVVNIAPGGKAILQEIKRLVPLRKLAVTGINKKNCQEFCSTLVHLTSLESLSVLSKQKEGLRDCLDSLGTPPDNLQSLKLFGTLGKLPKWVAGLWYLVKLKLQDTELTEVDGTMQVLGKLPNLAILRLLDRSFDAKGPPRFTSRGHAFPRLTTLELAYPEIESVQFEEGAAPELELLFCKAGITFSGLSSLPNLKEVVIDRKCSPLVQWMENLKTQLARNPNKPVMKFIH